ncbi:hypothetical protein J7J60_01635 [bacterium]|nr:hypothetical protein [bacterium]
MAQKNKNTTFLLGLISLVVVIGSVFYIVKQMNALFSFSKRTETTDLKVEDILSYLEDLDTDKDGLPDIEEVKYGTSIYLVDSDSDGFSDKQEVEAGSSPTDSSSVPSSPETKKQPEEPLLQEEIRQESGSSSLGQDIGENIDLSLIRNFLIQAVGLSADIVENIDDKTLVSVYNKVKEETGIGLEELQEIFNSNQSEGQASELEGEVLPDLEQLKKLFLEQGIITEEQLDQMSDEEFINLFMRYIESQ